MDHDSYRSMVLSRNSLHRGVPLSRVVRHGSRFRPKRPRRSTISLGAVISCREVEFPGISSRKNFFWEGARGGNFRRIGGESPPVSKKYPPPHSRVVSGLAPGWESCLGPQSRESIQGTRIVPTGVWRESIFRWPPAKKRAGEPRPFAASKMIRLPWNTSSALDPQAQQGGA